VRRVEIRACETISNVQPGTVHLGVRATSTALCVVCDRPATGCSRCCWRSPRNHRYLEGGGGGGGGSHVSRRPTRGLQSESDAELQTKKLPRSLHAHPHRVRRLAAYVEYMSSSCDEVDQSSSTHGLVSVRPHFSLAAVEVAESATCRRKGHPQSPTALAARLGSCIAQAGAQTVMRAWRSRIRPSLLHRERTCGGRFRLRMDGNGSIRSARRRSGASRDRPPCVGPRRSVRSACISSWLPERNGAQRQRQLIEAGEHARGGLRGRHVADDSADILKEVPV